jgi:hypothetical protein
MNVVAELRRLEGRCISLALKCGSRIDECQLVSVASHRRMSVWIYAQGEDLFVPVGEIQSVWEPTPCR